MEKELSNLFFKAKKAADVAAATDVSPIGAEVSRCMDALNQLICFPITKDLLLSTQVGKRLRSLKKHPKESIRSLALEIFQTWKDLFIKLINKEEKDSRSSARTNPMEKTTNKADDVHHMIMKISSVSSDNIGVCGCKIRERLGVALSRVATETEEESLKASSGGM
ncbi:hypothetical protein TIFTF001_043196 [Ficus carica]|uniref:TFIIS N-terminal domain-containing protein n=1 Tax=Ficus carica TaxID=3494 RepID=A0AA87YWX5_FICCA|nr:hypothetical protein TIFTF001_043196 [Ficus carica]